MSIDPLDKELSQVVRRQLKALRIDPDGVFQVRRPLRSRLNAWRRAHAEATLWIGLISLVVLVVLIIVATLLVLAPPSGVTEPGSPPPQLHNSTARASGGISVPISVGNLAINMTTSPYEPSEGMIVLHLAVLNTGPTLTTLEAGEMLLVDPEGALFPPSWRGVDGTWHDGLAESNHTLVGLEPAAGARIDVAFLVMGQGPFALRLHRDGAQLDTPLRGPPPDAVTY